jgi:hypothetical protein
MLRVIDVSQAYAKQQNGRERTHRGEVARPGETLVDLAYGDVLRGRRSGDVSPLRLVVRRLRSNVLPVCAMCFFHSRVSCEECLAAACRRAGRLRGSYSRTSLRVCRSPPTSTRFRCAAADFLCAAPDSHRSPPPPPPPPALRRMLGDGARGDGYPRGLKPRRRSQPAGVRSMPTAHRPAGHQFCRYSSRL